MNGSNESLIVRNDAEKLVNFTEAAQEIKNSALEASALIGRVSNAQEQEIAVNAQKELHRVLKLTEEARKACKEPVLAFGRQIDALAKSFQAELQAEEERVGRLVGDFQALELAKTRAAEAARLNELAEAERKRQAELAQAKSLDEIDSINHRFNDEAANNIIANIPQPPRVEGQTVGLEWEIIVTDIWALCRSHPLCVKIEPRMSEIRQLLDAGISVAGVRAERKVKAGVRLPRETKAIEVGS